jgi:hypothetical protein
LPLIVNDPPPAGRPDAGADVTVGANGGADVYVPPLYELAKPMMFEPLMIMVTIV